MGCPGRAKISSDMVSITNEHKNQEESETNVENRKLLTKVKHKIPYLTTSENEKVKKLLRYYERFWLEQIGPSRLSIFQNDKRTKNDLESFHAKLKRKFCLHNPNYWSFITKMNQVIKTTEKDI